MIVAICITGLAVAISAWLILSVVSAPRTDYSTSHRFERSRRDELRQKNFMYKTFEPAIDEIGVYLATKQPAQTKEFDATLSSSDLNVPWKASEFLATKILESVLYSGFAFVFLKVFLQYGMATSIALTVGCGFAIYYLTKSGVTRSASKRRRIIKRDFAAAIDLLALMMEVGGNFLDSLRVVAKEYSGKSLGSELTLIISDIELGKPRKQALETFAKRLIDEDISEVIFACNESEELGVPIAETLRSQANRIREKRSSWAEQAAQEAEVALTFPAMIIMIACLITVTAPFALSGWEAWGSAF